MMTLGFVIVEHKSASIFPKVVAKTPEVICCLALFIMRTLKSSSNFSTRFSKWLSKNSFLFFFGEQIVNEAGRGDNTFARTPVFPQNMNAGVAA